MKKIFVLAFAFCVLLCGCMAEDPQIEPKFLVIEIADYDEKSISYTVINNSNNAVELGEDYCLEYREGESWAEVSENGEVFFNMIAYVLNPGGEKSFSENLEIRYGVLESGTYRIIKDVRLCNEDGEVCGNQEVFAEFEIP